MNDKTINELRRTRFGKPASGPARVRKEDFWIFSSSTYGNLHHAVKISDPEPKPIYLIMAEETKIIRDNMVEISMIVEEETKGKLEGRMKYFASLGWISKGRTRTRKATYSTPENCIYRHRMVKKEKIT